MEALSFESRRHWIPSQFKFMRLRHSLREADMAEVTHTCTYTWKAEQV
jgi:hypothetical protein